MVYGQWLCGIATKGEPLIPRASPYHSMGESGEFCFATFPYMPTWFLYCHEESHMKFDCKKALANVLYYICDKYGHKQVDCLEAKYGTLKVNPCKEARKIPKVRKRSLIPPPSKELMKSTHTPGVKKDKEAKKAPK
jgi:hypothetical protein